MTGLGRGTVFGGLAALLLAGAPGAAGAEENGIRVGEGRLHPYFELESRYDSLVAWVGDDETGETQERYGDLGMHYRPGFDLEVPSDSTALKLSASVDFVQYLGAENEGTTDHSRVGAEVEGAVTFNRNGNVYVTVEDTFRRSDQTTTMILAVGTITDYNQASIRVGIQPGGKALLIEPGYSLGYEHFESYEGALGAECADNELCDPDSVNALDYLSHTAHLNAAWKFLPKTSAIFESSYSSRSYIGEIEATDGTGTYRPLEKFGTDNLRMMAGLTGLIAPKIQLTVKGGWGDQLTGDVGFKSAIGQVEGGFLASERLQFRAGYLRSFEPHPGASRFYSDDRVYGNLQAKFGENVSLEASAAYDRIEFGEDRTDDLIVARIGPSYQITPWLEGAVGFGATNRGSSNEDDRYANYDRTEYYARLKALY